MKQAKQYFENHDAINRLYFTSDSLAFFDEQNAINHARSLDDTTITAKTREEVDAELPDLNDEEEYEYDPLDELDAE